MKRTTLHFLADKDIQIILGTLLRIGIMVSVSMILLGAFVYLLIDGDAKVDYAYFSPGHSPYSNIVSIAVGVSQFKGLALVQCGVVMLIFTPVLRVVFSIFSFIIERDYLYVCIGLLVLAIILFSLSNTLIN